ncbi:MAG: MFS transporter [Lachnospiraceae bacterium]|nr:MFS transporter [Lachnospiraceae bacterium]
MKKKPITNTIKWLFGSANILIVMGSTFHSYYLTYILTDVMRLPMTNIAFLTSASSIITLVLATISGFVIQMINPGRMGRYRKTNLFMILLYFAFIWAGYTKYTDNVALLTIILTITLGFTKWLNSLNVSARNMLIAEISPDGPTRSMLIAHNTFYGGIGRIIYSLIIVGLLGFVQSHVSEAASFPIVFEIFLFFSVFGVLFEMWMTKGYDTTAEGVAEAGTPVEEKPTAIKKKPSFIETVKGAFSSFPLATLSASYFCTNIVYLFSTALLIYYYQYVAEDTSLYTVAVTINSVTTMLNGIITPWIAKKFGNKGCYVITLGASCLGLGICWLLGLNSAVAFTAGTVIVVMAQNMMRIPMAAMFGDCAVYSEWKSGIENRAITMNMYSIISTISGFVKNALVPLALAMSGYVAGQVASTEVKQGLVNAYCFFPIIFCVLALVTILPTYKLSDAKVREMQDEIDMRKSQS